MQLPKFIEKQSPDGYEYHLPVPSYKGFFSKSVFDNRFKELDPEAVEAFRAFAVEKGIAYFASRENVILYYLISEALAKQNTCYLVYFDNQNAIARVQDDAVSEKCEWRYSIEFRENDRFCRTFGFQSPLEFLHSVNYSDKDLTNRHFYISKIDRSNLNKYINLYNSDVTNWFIVFCSEDREEIVKEIFKDENNRPGLKTVLENAESMLNIQVGGDEGYFDYVLVQAKNKVDISAIERKLHRFITDYNQLLEEIDPMDSEWKIDFYMDRFDELIKSDYLH